MVMTDPISDMLTRIRNANRIKSKYVEIPISKIKIQITDILKEEGYISNYKILKDSNFSKNKKIRIFLKYDDKEKRRSLNGLRRISKPGLRVYVKSHQVPRVLSGLGIAIISTSKGLVTDKQARKESIGGEVLAYIW